VGERTGWLNVSRGKRALRVEVSAELAPALPQVLRRVRRLFDLSAEPEAIGAALGELVRNPGLRLPGAFDGFEASVRAILGQQVSVASARTLATRVAATFGTPIETLHPDLNLVFPKPERIAAITRDDLGRLGVFGNRAEALIGLAEAIERQEVRLIPGASPEETMERLRSIKGIGEWTAQYIAMRALSYPDAFPHTDLGVRKALGMSSPAETLARAEAWRPWRAYAVMHLWSTL
jgi:AraC family transcriptional regulator of adaptative response / DNA-3-methyladenine glycosylase II